MDTGPEVGLLRVQSRRRGVGEKSAGIAGEHGSDEAITDLMFVSVFFGPCFGWQELFSVLHVSIPSLF